MATQNTVNIGVNVSDNGTAKKVVKNFQEIEQAANRAQKAAQNTTMPAGGTAGSRAVYAKAAGGSQGLMSGEEYGRARGSMGTTGASARDFANQAQGLGGLVRLYATYAANLFAVSAAFSALKNAADTTALVSGLDKLGASSGRNLGTLSKQLVAATDGAISLRDAMTATAQTSSAGMSAQNILRLTAVAKNASLALGVSMPDALNRLSRGVTKLEPELLDELGLFTKIGPATEKYALEIGKSVSSLTDFERRQAFANAVIEEGEQKFAALGDAAANPYDKLLASLKNVGQSGLEVVNKVLQPAVELLAKSPVALGAGIAAVASILLRQAVPALNDFRQGLEQSAKAAGLAAVGKAGDAKRAREQLNSIIEKKVEESANVQLKVFEDLEAKLYAGAEKGVRRRSSLYQILKKDIVDITDADIASAEQSVKALEKRAKKDPVKIAQAGVERQTLEELKKVIDKEEELVRLKLENREAIEKNMQGQTQYARIQKAALDYEDKARKQSLVSNAAYNASLLGIRNSFTLLKEEIALSGLQLTKFGTGILYIRAGMASLVAVVGTLGSVINKAFFIFSSIAAVFGVLDSILSTSSKQAAVFTGAIDAAEGSVSNVSRTLDAVRGKGTFDEKTIQSTFALSNAMTDLADSANAAIKAADSVKKSMGVWDRIWDSIFSVANLDVDSKLSKTISEQISSAIKLLRVEGLNKEYEELLKTQLKISTLDPKSVAEAFNKLSDIEKAGVGKTLDAAKMKLGNISSQLQSFKSATDTAVKSYKELIQSTANTNPLFKVGEAFQNVAFESQKLVSQGLDGVLKAFDDIVKNPDKAVAFGDAFVESFAKIRTEFTEQKSALDANSSALQFYEDRLASVNDQLANMQKYSGTRQAQSSMAAGVQQQLGQPVQVSSTLEKEKQGLQAAIDTLKKVRVGLDTSAIKSAQQLFADGIEHSFKKGAELTLKALNEAYQKAALSFAKAAATALTGERRAREENRIAQEELQIQLNAIDVNLSLLNVQERLVAEMQLSNAYQAKANALDENAKKVAEDQLKVAIAASKLSQGRLTGEDLASMSPETKANFDPIKAAKERANIEQKAQRALIEGQLKAQRLLGSMAERGGRVEDQQKIAQITEQINQQLISRSNTLQSISGITTKDMVLQQAAAETNALELKQQQELAPILLAKANAQESVAKSTGKGKKEAEKEVEVQENLLNATKARQRLELDNKGLQDRQKLLQVEYDLITKRFESDKQAREISQSRLDAQNDIAEAEFNAYSALLGYSEQYINNIRYAFEIQKAQAAFTKATAEANAAYDEQKARNKAKLETISASFDGDMPGPAGQEAINAIIAEDERARQARDTAITQATILLDKNKQLSEVTKTVANEQARYNELLANTTGLATALAGAFGDVGNAIGSAVSSIVELGISQEKASKALDEMGSKWAMAAASSGEDSKEAIEYGKEYMRLTEKSQKAEIAGTAKILGAAKNMFKEKTTGYKVMAAAEKALHMVSIALELKTLGIKLSSYTSQITAAVAAQAAKTGIEGAGFAARLPLYIAEIYASWGAWGPWMAGAAAVFIASKLGGFGGGGRSSAGFAMNSEQRQETQGTGTTYNSKGEKVEIAGGVFGDSAAKVDSINKSLEIIRDNSVEGLAYDNKMLKALQGLSDALTGAATAIYAIPGLRQGGTSFGSQTGTTSEGGFLSDIPLIGGVLGSIFGGGTSASSSIESAGIQLKGSFQQLIDDTTSSVRQYKDILTQFHEDGGWFGSDSDWTERRRETADIGAAAASAIRDVFVETKSLFTEIGASAGVTASRVQEVFSSVGTNIDIDLKGLTGDEITKELNAVIGSRLDAAAQILFSSFDQYKKFGESYLTTVVRVVDTNTKIQQILTNMGIDQTVSGVYGITESLAKLAGGLDKFVAQYDFFKSNFLTEAEQIAPIQQAVTTEMSRLGYSSVDTREEFKLLVQSLNLSSEAGRATFTALMNVQEGFFAVTAAAQREADERIPLEKKLAQLGASKDKLRQLELEDLYEGNRQLQREIWLKEDQINAAKALQSSLQNVTKTIRSQITSLQDYKLALQSGSNSTLTATQQYTLAKSEVDKLVTTITKAATTPEEIEARSTAIGKLSSATDKFLGMSRGLYASGAQYTTDFNTVMSIINSVSSGLETQLTDAQKQLSALEASNAFLESISETSKSTAQLLQTYLSLGGTSLSTPGFAVGTNYVPHDMVAKIHQGERIIPMADNFKLMTSLASSDNYSREMVVQIRNLNQKIDSLEKTVAEGAVINAQATERNTEQIAQAVVDSSGKTIQANRLQARAGIK